MSDNTVPIGVLASGTGSNFRALLDAQDRGGLAPGRIVLLVCNKPGAGALGIAEERGVSGCLVPHRDFADRESFERAMIAGLEKAGVRLVVLAGFMRVLTPLFVGHFRSRIINLHPSLLPAFPGADAIGDALAHGVRVTGVTVHLVDEGLDSGPILAQEAVVVEQGDTRESLAARIHAVEHRLLPATVAGFARRILEEKASS